MGNMRIIHLVDMPEALPTLAEWFFSEWKLGMARREKVMH